MVNKEAMNQSNRRLKVLGRDGLLGWIDLTDQPDESPDVQVHLEDGRTLVVPAGYFLEQEDGYYLPLSREQIDTLDHQASDGEGRQSLMVVPIIAEQVEVGRRRVTTGRVRLHKRVSERREQVSAQRIREQVEVTRVPVNRAVDTPPQVRYEGDTMVIPVLEEVLVVQKKLVLREEVRVRKVRQNIPDPQTVTLRSEQIDVERLQGTETTQED